MNSDNFIFIGDSLTFGYGVPKSKCWVEIFKNSSLSKDMNLNIINKGINGNTTTDMLNRFTEDVTMLSPKKIFIMGGTNDLLSNRPINLIIDNIELMLKEALTITSDVFLGVPPRVIKEDAYRLFMPSLTYDYCENKLPELSKELIKLCKKYKANYIDFYNLTLEIDSSEIFLDGIHFTEEGHKFLLQSFIENIKRNI